MEISAVAAAGAGLCPDRQLAVMIVRHAISRQRKIVVFVDQADIQPRRAGLTVVAVNAVSDCRLRRELSDYGVVVLRPRGIWEGQQRMQVVKPPHARHGRQHSRPVEHRLKALIFRQRPPKGRGFFRKQLPAVEGLHDRDTDSLRFTSAKQLRPLAGRTDTVFVPALQIIGRIDREHQHIHKPRIKQPVGNRRRVRGKTDVTDNPLRLKFADMVEDAVFPDIVKVAFLIHAVQKTKVRIVGSEGMQLPVEGFPDFVQIPRPSVLSARIVHRAEMQLKIDLLPHLCDRASKRGIDRSAAGTEVEKVNALRDSLTDDRLNLLRRGFFKRARFFEGNHPLRRL